jgi:hypothetical protein
VARQQSEGDIIKKLKYSKQIFRITKERDLQQSPLVNGVAFYMSNYSPFRQHAYSTADITNPELLEHRSIDGMQYKVLSTQHNIFVCEKVVRQNENGTNIKAVDTPMQTPLFNVIQTVKPNCRDQVQISKSFKE